MLQLLELNIDFGQFLLQAVVLLCLFVMTGFPISLHVFQMGLTSLVMVASLGHQALDDRLELIDARIVMIASEVRVLLSKQNKVEPPISNLCKWQAVGGICRLEASQPALFCDQAIGYLVFQQTQSISGLPLCVDDRHLIVIGFAPLVSISRIIFLFIYMTLLGQHYAGRFVLGTCLT